MPKRFPIYKKLDNGIIIRRMPVENFSVFYSVADKENTVVIHKVIYSKRDIDKLV